MTDLPPTYHDVTLAILAGGQGSRLGKPKAELRINGRPILEYLLERFDWPGPTLLVTAPGRENPPGAARFTREVVDQITGYGPMCGILTALENTPMPLVLVTAVDMPLAESKHLRQLADELRSRAALLGLMTRHRTGEDMQIEPLPGVFHIDAAAALHERIAARRFSLRDLSRDPQFPAIDVDWEPVSWMNINTQEDIERLRALGLRID